MKNKCLNKKTEKTLLNQKKFNKSGGIAKYIIYENNFLLKTLDLKDKDLIEFGCGIFPISIGLNKYKDLKSYTASDVSPKIIKKAKINDNRPNYIICDLEKKIKINKKFDVIILKGVLHHTKEPGKILIKLKKILKNNGFMVISEPNLSSIIGNFLKSLLRICFKVSLEDSPYGQYDFKKISQSIKRANLTIKNKWYSGLFIVILSGDYGRLKILPNYVWICNIIIKIENIFFFLLKFTGVLKYLNFKINIVIQK